MTVLGLGSEPQQSSPLSVQLRQQRGTDVKPGQFDSGEMTQAEGLEFTSATRGSFLMSITALLTPGLAILGGEATTRSTIIASLMAVLGVGLIVADDTAGVPGVSASNQMIGGLASSWQPTAVHKMREDRPSPMRLSSQLGRGAPGEMSLSWTYLQMATSHEVACT